MYQYFFGTSGVGTVLYKEKKGGGKRRRKGEGREKKKGREG